MPDLDIAHRVWASKISKMLTDWGLLLFSPQPLQAAIYGMHDTATDCVQVTTSAQHALCECTAAHHEWNRAGMTQEAVASRTD